MTRTSRQQFSCGVELALEVLGGKWKAVILAHLKEQPLRYGELRARMPGLSEKMLTQRLRDLEVLGLVKKHKSGRAGAPSIYRITARADSLPGTHGTQRLGSVRRGGFRREDRAAVVRFRGGRQSRLAR